MKNLFFSLLVVIFAVYLGGCAMVQSPSGAFLYTSVSAPLTATSNEGSSKSGTGEITNILGWISTGDASIQTIAKNAGITKIHHIDYKSSNILGIYAKFVVTVYGE